MNGPIFDTRRHTNVKAKAAYRRIGKNFKGLDQLKKERLRRLKVLELQRKGLKNKQIAAELKVSESTVKRDLAKLRPTIERAFRRALNSSAEAERQQLIKKLSGLPPDKQAKLIAEFLAGRQNLVGRKRVCCKLTVTFDVDAALKGQEAIKFKPPLPLSLASSGVINFRILHEGKSRYVNQLTLC